MTQVQVVGPCLLQKVFFAWFNIWGGRNTAAMTFRDDDGGKKVIANKPSQVHLFLRHQRKIVSKPIRPVTFGKLIMPSQPLRRRKERRISKMLQQCGDLLNNARFCHGEEGILRSSQNLRLNQNYTRKQSTVEMHLYEKLPWMTGINP